MTFYVLPVNLRNLGLRCSCSRLLGHTRPSFVNSKKEYNAYVVTKDLDISL
jgi:hypothetical protein